MDPIVSIVIPVFNKWEYTYKCLMAVARNSRDVDHEVIVVDNGSSDETARALPLLGESPGAVGLLLHVPPETAANDQTCKMGSDTDPQRGVRTPFPVARVESLNVTGDQAQGRFIWSNRDGSHANDLAWPACTAGGASSTTAQSATADRQPRCAAHVRFLVIIYSVWVGRDRQGRIGAAMTLLVCTAAYANDGGIQPDAGGSTNKVPAFSTTFLIVITETGNVKRARK